MWQRRTQPDSRPPRTIPPRHNCGARIPEILSYHNIVHGAGTEVHGGSITGGTKGVSVQAGASLDATDLTVTDVRVSGVEVKNEGSYLKLAMCKLHNFRPITNGNMGSVGVHVRASSRTELCSLSISCSDINNGVEVCTSASATPEDCSVSHP